MASITKIIKFSKQLPVKPTNPNFINSVRTAVHLRDWMPAQYPKTEEERIKAARKYNLHPDEYVPFEEENRFGMNRGDYPNIPEIGFAGKDPYYPWDMPAERRNYKETLPENYDFLGPDKLDATGTREFVTNSEAFRVFFGTVGTFLFLVWLVDDYKWFPEVMEKQWPQEGVKHYTFEPAD